MGYETYYGSVKSGVEGGFAVIVAPDVPTVLPLQASVTILVNDRDVERQCLALVDLLISHRSIRGDGGA